MTLNQQYGTLKYACYAVNLSMSVVANFPPLLLSRAAAIGLAPEQLGMKLGMLSGMLFPLLGILVVLYFCRRKNKQEP